MSCYHRRGYDLLPCQVVSVSTPSLVCVHQLIMTTSRQALKHVADGGTMAEEVISTIRTAQAFGNQNTLSKIYGYYVGKALALDIRSSSGNALAFSIFFFAVYGSYGLGGSRSHFVTALAHALLLAFHYGTTLVNQAKGTCWI